MKNRVQKKKRKFINNFICIAFQLYGVARYPFALVKEVSIFYFINDMNIFFFKFQCLVKIVFELVNNFEPILSSPSNS